MERLVKGDIVVMEFPFTNFESSIKRPAFVAAAFEEDCILCQITSKLKADKNSIIISDVDFIAGTINLVSAIRADKIFTAHKSLIQQKIGSLKKEKITEATNAICDVFTN